MSEISESVLLIDAHGVSISFRDKTVLADVDLSIGSGEIVTLVGPNGAGKSTLARIVLDLLQPDCGTVLRKSGLTIGYQPQRLNINSVLPLTVRRFLQVTQRHPDDQLTEALTAVEVPHLMERDLHTLSGGELQRVMLVRAVLRKPQLLVLDEPTQNVDITGAAEIYELIENIRKSYKCGILLISHDLNVVMSATDRVYCLNNHLCCSGKPEDVSQHPEFLSLFGTDASQKLALYTHDHDHTHGPSGEIIHHEHGHDQN